MSKQIVAEGMLLNPWDRISGTVQCIDAEGSRVMITPRKRSVTVTVQVDDCAEISLDGRGAGIGSIQPGYQLAAIGRYMGQLFQARCVRLYSSARNPDNASRESIRPPAIVFQLLDTGEVLIRRVGHPGEEVHLLDHEEFEALMANTEQLRLLHDPAQMDKLPRRG